jgi:hypothetical protein
MSVLRFLVAKISSKIKNIPHFSVFSGMKKGLRKIFRKRMYRKIRPQEGELIQI